MFEWLAQLPTTQPMAHAVLVLASVSVLGLGLGSVNVRGICLGTAGVLFAGIVVGHLWRPVDHTVLEFVREFGLILFVFTIGLQLGPGFFAALRHQGLLLNGLATGVLVLGALIAAITGWAAGLDSAAVAGLFSGATTNTPSLGAAQQALTTREGVSPDLVSLAALAYAVAYPIGILGTIGSLLTLRVLFRIDPSGEAAALQAEQQRDVEPLERRTLVVDNPNLEGVTLGAIPGRIETGVMVSRIRPTGRAPVRTATDETPVHVGDAVLAVGTRRMLDQFQLVVGHDSDEDLREAPGEVTHRQVIVTHKEVLGRTVRELGLGHLYGVAVTRITRADLEMTAVPNLRLQFGDVLQVVGEPLSIEKVAAYLGNSPKALNETQFIPMFVGIVLGILVGGLPIAIPGLPQPVRLGLAGGPLVVAIVLGRVGRIGPLVWYMPGNANLAFRELGITLFLACVGLMAGERFFQVVLTTDGLLWLLAATAIAIVPLLAVGITARLAYGMNYTTLAGLLAGSMTDPPALAFANGLTRSDGPSLAYATVYPLTMGLRILMAQVLVLVL